MLREINQMIIRSLEIGFGLKIDIQALTSHKKCFLYDIKACESCKK